MHCGVICDVVDVIIVFICSKCLSNLVNAIIVLLRFSA